ncbi:uncharacterized protein LOC100366768 [Saccoglossus kowalevskii]|uniref:UPF0676 protein C1494.01-like n=1 Tax=Saccoglossus kowalevskii TaxID=10224 RepID=A0ABM0MIM9_SACKO|nr:PREDICTED: UPF0676 protein C1494.01-like [Saccoglossus kowalevskii]
MTTMVPIIDFDACSLARSKVASDRLPELARSLLKSLSVDGVVILKNHGIDEKEIRSAFDLSDEFFRSPADNKLLFEAKSEDNFKIGYAHSGTERYSRVKNFREAFRLRPGTHSTIDTVVPGFVKAQQLLFTSMGKLVQRLVRLLAIGLEIDENVFTDKFKKMGEEGNSSYMMHNWYTTEQSFDKSGEAIRLFGHFDNSALTLLVTSKHPGLQFRNREGEWSDVPPSGDNIIVLIGQIMEAWTEDKLKAPFHRVTFPERDQGTDNRMSCAFFAIPDNAHTICSIHGSEKYPPFKPDVFFVDKLNVLYK